MLNDVHQQRAVARGIETYVQVLAERKQVAPAVLAEVTYIPSPAYPNSSDDADVCSAYALLLYLRCSSPDQIQHGFSIPDQLARLRAEAGTAGERVVAEFIDQARSGTSAATRAEYQKLLAAARRRAFEQLRFESVDRGHRNDFERREFEQEMQGLGIEVVYSGEPEKQAPQYRKLQRGIKGVLAEWESDEAEEQIRKLRLGIEVLDEKARAIELTLTNPFCQLTHTSPMLL